MAKLTSTNVSKNKPPVFKSEAEERAFWENPDTDTSMYFDESSARELTFKNLKPSTTSISLRMTESLLDGIKAHANKMDVPYQSLMKVWLAEKLKESNKRR